MKRGLFIALMLIGFVIAAASPIGAASVAGEGLAQATYPPPGPTIEITVIPPIGPTPAPQADPGTGLSATVVIGLLVIVLIAVVVGGIALVSRGRS